MPLIFETHKNKQQNGYMYAGGINDVIHPGSHKLVVSLPTIENIKGIYLVNSDKMNEKYNCSFEYEIYAEGCQPIQGEMEISAEDIKAVLPVQF